MAMNGMNAMHAIVCRDMNATFNEADILGVLVTDDETLTDRVVNKTWIGLFRDLGRMPCARELTSELARGGHRATMIQDTADTWISLDTEEYQ